MKTKEHVVNIFYDSDTIGDALAKGNPLIAKPVGALPNVQWKHKTTVRIIEEVPEKKAMITESEFDDLVDAKLADWSNWEPVFRKKIFGDKSCIKNLK